eukprot:TRINITY_DN2121_c0_g1_i1.p1 TRINITY_DN2121_c0_g1~~TRINITY_DN2121_c0_g1_i1.p1  ORF type:complete len:441 (+),score=125.60 TRINITY_DN2121_c0_g1_i1:76-1398(+)
MSASSVAGSALGDELVLLRCDELIDGVAPLPIPAACVVFARGGGRGSGAIRYAGPEAALPEEVRGLCTHHMHAPVVMPGLWDCHVHLLGVKTTNFSIEVIQSPKALLGARCAICLQHAIEAGVTSVRDVGGLGVEVVGAVEEGTLVSPHVYSAGGFLSITAGHGDFHDLELGLACSQLERLFDAPTLCDGPWEARKAVRAQIRRGAHLIKVMASGGVLSRRDDPHHQEFTNEELRAIVDEARSKDRCVAAHCHGVAGIRSSIECGVRTIEHGTYLTRELCEQMKAKDMILVPTFFIQRRLFKLGSKAGMAPESVEKMNEVVRHHSNAMREAYKCGVTFALGTDILSCGEQSAVPWGMHAHELKYMVEIGMSPMEAIQAGTANGPLTLGMRAPKSGKIVAGYDADILLLGVSPLPDVSVLEDRSNILAVIKDGTVLVDRRQ